MDSILATFQKISSPLSERRTRKRFFLVKDKRGFLFIYLLIYLFIYLFTYLFTYLLIYLFIYLFIFSIQIKTLRAKST